MTINDRFNVIKQGAIVAQGKGVLTLDDAVYVKKAIDTFDKNMDASVKILSKVIQVAQSKGVYSLKDAYYLFIALDGIDDEIKKYQEFLNTPKPASEDVGTCSEPSNSVDENEKPVENDA